MTSYFQKEGVNILEWKAVTRCDKILIIWYASTRREVLTFGEVVTGDFFWEQTCGKQK